MGSASAPSLVGLRSIVDSRGELIVAEMGAGLPFIVRRFFILRRNVWRATRGGHAHKTLRQFLVCVNGRVVVQASDAFGNVEKFELRDPRSGLLVPPMTWLDVDLSFQSALLVLASDKYDEADYIRERAAFFK